MRRVAIVLLVLALLLSACSLPAVRGGVSLAQGWLSVTLIVDEQPVIVQAICLPGCVEYPVAEGR